MLYTGSPCAGEHPESTVIQNPTRAGCAWNVPTMVHVAVSTNEEAVLMTGFVGCALVTPKQSEGNLQENNRGTGSSSC